MIEVQGRIVKDETGTKVVFRLPCSHGKEGETYFHIPHDGLQVKWNGMCLADKIAYTVVAGQGDIHSNQADPDGRQRKLHRCSEGCPK